MTLVEAIESYILYRHSNGSAYVNQAGCLRSLPGRISVDDLEDLQTEDVRPYIRAEGLKHGTASKRFTLISKFIQFHQARGRATAFEMPPRPRYMPQEFTPHIYSPAEVQSILAAAETKEGTIPPRTFQALILFLYGTGCSLFSAVHFAATDLDVNRGLATLENQRGNGRRTIPLNRRVLAALVEYASWKASRDMQGNCFFQRNDGTPLVIPTVGSHFRAVLNRAKCARRDGSTCRPRLYDFRATFAVQRISEWIKSGADLGRMLPALAAYMGMIDLTVTEQYLALSPERFRKELEKLSAASKGFSQ